jgi:hypothetical protein
MRKRWAYLLICCLWAFSPLGIVVWRLSSAHPTPESVYLGRTTGWWEAECQQWEVIAEFPGDCWWGEPETLWGRRPALAKGNKMPLLAGDRAAVPVLVELLNSRKANVRRIAAQGLGEVGPAAEPSVPALIAAVKDRDRGVQNAAALALFRVDPEAAGKAGLTWDRNGRPILRPQWEPPDTLVL